MTSFGKGLKTLHSSSRFHVSLGSWEQNDPPVFREVATQLHFYNRCCCKVIGDAVQAKTINALILVNTVQNTVFAQWGFNCSWTYFLSLCLVVGRTRIDSDWLKKKATSISFRSTSSLRQVKSRRSLGWHWSTWPAKFTKPVSSYVCRDKRPCSSARLYSCACDSHALWQSGLVCGFVL